MDQVLSDLDHAHTRGLYHLADMLNRLWPEAPASRHYRFFLAAVHDAHPKRDEIREYFPGAPTGRVLVAGPDPGGHTQTTVIEARDRRGARLTKLFGRAEPRWPNERLGHALAATLHAGAPRRLCSMKSVCRLHATPDGKREGYFIFAVLFMDGDFPSVDPGSFAEYALRHWLDEATETPQMEEPWIQHRPDEIMRRAAEHFVTEITAADRASPFRLLAPTAFDCLNELASLTYEKADATGVIDIATTRKAAKPDIPLKEPVELAQRRRVRKLLHATHEDLGLLVFNDQVIGMRRRSQEWGLTVRFRPRGAWEVVQGGQIAMRVVRGSPEVPQRSPAEDASRSVRDRLARFSSNACTTLRDAVDASLRERHGATFVVSTEAKDEAKRLVQQDTEIKPRRLDGPTLADLGRVDGAVLLSLAGDVHAFGVILDGDALPLEVEDPLPDGVAGLRERIHRRQIQRSQPDPSRGARFNSAITYSHSRVLRPHKPELCVVIVSEDGIVTVVPTEGDLHAWTRRVGKDPSPAVKGPQKQGGAARGLDKNASSAAKRSRKKERASRRVAKVASSSKGSRKQGDSSRRVAKGASSTKGPRKRKRGAR